MNMLSILRPAFVAAAGSCLSYVNTVQQIPDSVDRLMASAGVGLAAMVASEVVGGLVGLVTLLGVCQFEATRKGWPVGEVLLEAGHEKKGKVALAAGYAGWALGAFLAYGATQEYMISKFQPSAASVTQVAALPQARIQPR